MKAFRRVSRGLQDMLLLSHALSRKNRKSIGPRVNNKQGIDAIRGKTTRHIAARQGGKTNGHNDRTIQLLRIHNVRINRATPANNFHLREQHFHAAQCRLTIYRIKCN